MAEFIKQIHNSNISHQGFLIEIYLRELPHELFFIILMLWKTIVIRPTKILVALYAVRDLAFLD